MNLSTDAFFRKGQQIMEEERERHAQLQEIQEQRAQEEENVRIESRNVELLEGKLKREELKLSLFRYLYS
jgi:hypothetical protein